MLYLYRRAGSQGARDVVESLQELGVNSRRLNDLQKAHFGQGVRSGDHVIFWGEGGVTLPQGVIALNNVAIRTKYQDAVTLREAGVPTIQVALTRPAAERPQLIQVDTFPTQAERVKALVDTFGDAQWARGPVFRDASNEIIRELTALSYLGMQPIPQAPVTPVFEWLGRRNNHVGGTDLLRPSTQPDYYSRKEDIVREFRIHSFKGRSIRAGQKAHRTTGLTGAPHTWIRSYDAGWFLNYENFESGEEMRELAKQAVRALGLDFGAVDIGQLRNGNLIVLEVNRAAGSEGGTSNAYASAINRWIQGEFNEARQGSRRRTGTAVAAARRAA